MDEKAILATITGLVEEEHQLRSAIAAGTITAEDEHARLRTLEEHLDQCWDLLRRRRAAQGNHKDPDLVQPRTTGEVEAYLQ
jgi:hypothetical protein